MRIENEPSKSIEGVTVNGSKLVVKVSVDWINLGKTKQRDLAAALAGGQ